MRSVRRRQLAAVTALLAYVAVVVLILLTLVDHPGQLVAAWVAALVGLTGAWIALTRRGIARIAGAVLGVAGFGVTVVLLLRDTALFDVIGIAAVWALAAAAGRYAVGVDRAMLRDLPPPGLPAPQAQRPVLLMNPWSGGGKVVKFDLVARSRATRDRTRRAPGG